MKRIGPLINGSWWLIITVIIMVSIFFSVHFLKSSLIHEDQCRGERRDRVNVSLYIINMEWCGGGGGGGGNSMHMM